MAIDAPRRRGDVTLQRVGDDAILHDASNRRIHVINSSAALALELTHGRPFEEIVAAFAVRVGLGGERVGGDRQTVLDRIVDQRLVDAA